MRALRVVLFAALTFAVATASFLGTMAPPGPTAMPSSDSPRTDMYVVERLVRELADAVTHNDLKRTADLIADDAVIRLTDYSCMPINKSTFVNLLNNSEIAAQIIVVLESAVSSGIGVFRYQDAFLAAKNTPFENMTFSHYGLLTAQATADGKQLMQLQKFTDTSAQFPNVSATLLTSWYNFGNASVSSDVSSLNNILNATAEYAIFVPGAKMPEVLNRSTILEGVAYDATHRQFEKVSYDLLYPSCELVVTLVTSYTAMKDGMRYVNKYFIAGDFSPASGQLARLSEFPIFSEDDHRHHH